MLKSASRLFLVSLIVLAASCAPRRIELPSYEGQDFGAYLRGLEAITRVETRMSIVFEKTDSEMRGDGVLEVSKNGDMSIRVYSLGFLALELSSRDGAITSNPRVEKNRSLILTRGLRDCIFWWDAGSGHSEEGTDYILSSPERRVWVDRKTFLPVRQVIRLENGRDLNVLYGEPSKHGDLWYPSKVTIELGNYRVTVTIKTLEFRS